MTESENPEERAEQLEALGSFGANTQAIFAEAWTFFVAENETGRHEAETICRRLLNYPQLSDLFKAGCHLIMAYGAEDFLMHAEKAVVLYENLYTVRLGSSFRGDFVPTSEALSNQAKLVDQAKRVLERAREDDAAIEAGYQRLWDAYVEHHGREPINEELVAADMRLLPATYPEQMNEVIMAMDRVMYGGEEEQETSEWHDKNDAVSVSDSEAEEESEVRTSDAGGP